MSDPLSQLPLQALGEDFRQALGTASVLLEAEPGAGKSTLAPLWAMETLGGEGQIWLVQPRVLPALSLAGRLAQLRGEPVGETVGYQVPFDNRHGESTSLLLMTPGVLLQRLLADPELTGVAAVILDEVHERSVDQDTAWALLQEAAVLRDRLALILMSATPDSALRRQVETTLYSPGRCYPVTVEHCPPRVRSPRDEPLDAHVLRALEATEHWLSQTVLVFLPGWRAIDQTRRALQRAFPGHPVYCLHSRVERAEQMAALDPARGARVILATNIAETSLTIADVTLVVDSGLAREAVYEQKTGVTRLQTRRIAAANAEQRRGRAGRVRAGHCIRLWRPSEALAPQPLPEIRRCDYLPLALRVAHWGTAAEQLPWLEPPGRLALNEATGHLQRWGFVTGSGAITDTGARVSALGTHPRVAALLLHSRDYLHESPWLWLLALALHFDWSLEPDLEAWLASAYAQYRRDKRWQQIAKRWGRVLALPARPDHTVTALPAPLADDLAVVFADRIGHRRESGRYRLNSGVSVSLAVEGAWALVLHMVAQGQGAQGVGLGVNLSRARIRELAQSCTTVEPLGTGRRRRWVESTRYRIGGEVVERTERALTGEQIPGAIVDWVRQSGLAALDWSPKALTLLVRARWAQKVGLMTLPALDVATLEREVAQWLGGFVRADSDLQQLPLAEALAFYLGYGALQKLDEQLPEQVTLPSGRRLSVNYLGNAPPAELVAGQLLPEPVIAAKLQEFFGAAHFALPAGSVPLEIELLSPAGRPLAITRDLAFFWERVYPEVRRQERGRYAKHPWPEDPLAHRPTGLTKKRLGS